MTAALTSATTPPTVRRVRHETRIRPLEVTAVDRLTPHMVRIALRGDDMADFISASPDDHLKVLIDGPEGERQMRDYTPRRFSCEDQTLLLDFAVHDAGPATQWALDARPGDQLNIGGPRGSRIIEGDIRNWLLIGDETALPAIGRRIEEASADTQFTTVIAIPGPDDRQTFDTAAKVNSVWIYRPVADAAKAEPFMKVIEDVTVTDDTFVWIAAEGLVTRGLRQHFLDTRQHPPNWLKAAGYWVKGQADTTESFE